MARKFDQGFLLALAVATLVQSSTAQTAHVVGGALNWIVPPGGATAYSTWAANQTFRVGDILEFNFATGRHDVAEVTKAAFDACNTANPISRVTTSPANITLNSAGEHYYICTFTGHCGAGQKLAVNVSTSGAASPAPQPSSPAPQPSSSSPVPTPSSSPTPTQVPTSAPTPAPTRSPVTYIVGDSMGLGWTVPPNSSETYQLWARGKTFMVGDTLVFNYNSGTHDVAEMTKEAYGSCDTNSTLSLETNPPTRITLTTSGEHYFTCTYPRHCPLGQKLAINVTGSNTVSPGPSPTGGTAPSTPTTPSSPSPTGAVTPPPSPGNSAKSLGVALSSTFLAIFVGFLY